jgi:hydrogenase maturation protease
MHGYDGLIVVDAVDRGAAPGTVFVLQPEVPEPTTLDVDEWRERFSNLHLAEPSRVFLLARALGVLPDQVYVVGCRPLACEDFSQRLSPPVQAAVPIAARRVLDLLTQSRKASAREAPRTDAPPARPSAGPPASVLSPQS